MSVKAHVVYRDHTQLFDTHDKKCPYEKHWRLKKEI